MKQKMTYEEEYANLRKWYKDMADPIEAEMLLNPVPGLDHPLQSELIKLNIEFGDRLIALYDKYGIQTKEN